MSADYIVIGAGSAGCVVTRRLVEAGYSVELVEAGPRDHPLDFRLHMPAALSEVLSSTRYNWSFSTEPESQMINRRMFCPRGRTLGGSSAINGMIFVRGHPRDFDRWAERSGYPDWGYEHCLPYFKRSETATHGDPAWRGQDGPMRITQGALANPLFHAYLESGAQAGHARHDDLNGAQQEGVGPFDRTIFDGKRWSAARGYLDPLRNNGGLAIRTGTRTLALRPARRQVDILEAGSLRTLEATREIILCAGAIGSPQLLMLSGIGDADHLRSVGIEPEVHLPGVGRNLQDHLEVYVQYRCSRPVSLYPALKPYNKAWIGPLWYLARQGPGATNHFEAGGFIRSSEGVAWPDLQMHFLPIAMSYDGSHHAAGHGFQVHVGPMKPTSRGTVRLATADPMAAPLIRFNYASTAEDRAVMRAGIRKVRDLVAQPAFDDFRAEELSPGVDWQSDDALDAFVARHGESAYHPSGTCRMGQDADAVVDDSGRVHGVDGLRVIDASVMPEITNGNLNAPVLMLAEKMVSGLVR